MSDLASSLERVATSPVLLVACDFDGTLAPIVDHPSKASADPHAWDALAGLARLDRTHAIIVSGRNHEDLAGRVGLAEAEAAGVRLIGSHGLEIETGMEALKPEAKALLKELEGLVRSEAERLEGALVEVKPASAAFHWRMVGGQEGERAAERIAERAAGIGGGRGEVHVLKGHKVVELFVVRPSKGRAVQTMRHRVGATAVVYIGDDVTDEDAFAALTPTELGIKVGQGPTVASVRVHSQAEVKRVLSELLERRREWVCRCLPVPIEKHAIVSDMRTVFVLDPRGTVVWACLPRIDSPPIFALLLGGEEDGCFSILPEEEVRECPNAKVEGAEWPRQEYIGDSMVLRTEWAGFTVTDYLEYPGAGEPGESAPTRLVRVIEAKNGGVAGSATRVRVRFVPRLDFGRCTTRLVTRGQGLEVDGWPTPIELRAWDVGGEGLEWEVREGNAHHHAEATIELSRGPVVLELSFADGEGERDGSGERAQREKTRKRWAEWVAKLKLPDVRPDLVRRSALAIRALTYAPTGAICAAATTSLPEQLGGVRNWDYRYCWIRDAFMSASSLVRLGDRESGLRLLDWLLGIVERTKTPERLRPVYTVTGEELAPEADIGNVAGYGCSLPVRIGNAASMQVQLDVFGPIVELISLLEEAGVPEQPEHWRLVEQMVEAVASRWHEPDHGIWEFRTPKRHNVHTKVMCWFAVDRALRIAGRVKGRERPVWRELRRDIAADVEAKAWNAAAGKSGAFAAAYGSTAIDAAVLAIGLKGMVPPMDKRFVATVDAVEHSLREGPVVHRYYSDDGLPGREGGWLLCAAWLVEALAITGRRERALEMFDELCALAGPTGLMSEQYDPAHKTALGNFPQAYSHLGVINAAVRLSSGEGTPEPAA